MGESTFLSSFFDRLSEARIVYAVLRNADKLPESLDGSDLDILVRHEDFAAVACVISELTASHGGHVIVRRKAGAFCQFMLLGHDGLEWWGVCVDLFDGVTWRGFLPVCAQDAIAYRVKNAKGIWTFDDETAHLIGFAKEWLVNGRVSRRYESLACAAIGTDKSGVLTPVIADAVGKLLKGANVSVVRFRMLQIIRCALSHPITFCKYFIGFQIGKVFRFLKPGGAMVAVLGTDGSGKSTLLNVISPVLNQTVHNQLKIHHLRPDLLPPLGRLRGVKYKPGYVCTTPHKSRPSGVVGSFLRIVYLTLDYALGYWIKVRPHLAKIPTGSWIFDRYAYDMILDPLRFRIKLPNRIISFFANLVPKPDLILCLGGDPEKIYARKPETSLDEVRRQVAELKKFCDGNRRAVWVDTTMSVDESKNAALKAITESMSKRYN